MLMLTACCIPLSLTGTLMTCSAGTRQAGRQAALHVVAPSSEVRALLELESKMNRKIRHMIHEEMKMQYTRLRT